jgi:Ca2+-binding EF-hand superfamily protein
MAEETMRVPDLQEVSPAVLERYLRRLFSIADVDNNGVLDQREFSKLLQKSGLGFSQRMIRKLMMEADSNQDGVIQYDEYVPIMLEIIQALRVKSYKQEDEAEARQGAVSFLLNGVSEASFERQILKTFMSADKDNNGFLDRNEFIECIRAVDMGLTKKEIMYLMAEIDVNADGKVQYDEFVPLAVQIITDLIADKILESSGRMDLQNFFIDTFLNYDHDNTGLISVTNLRDALAAIGLSTIQVQTVVAEANPEAGGLIKYRSFARVVAQMFSDFFQWRDTDKTDSTAGSEEAEYEEADDLSMSPEELERFLRQLFYQADKESNGYLHPRDFAQLLRNCGLGFSGKTIRKVIEEADVDNNGRIDYLEYVTTMVQIVFAEQGKANNQKRAWEDEARARAAATEFLLQGVSRDWLERSMLKMFMQADLNNSGALDISEFITCLRGLDLGLTRKEITFIMSECDSNHDGLISYQEFVPLCFDLLVELIKEKFLEDHGSLRLQEYLVDIFREYDHKGSGKVSLSQLREALSLCSLSLTAVQVQAIVSEARQDESGLVNYQPFSRTAAMMVSDMLTTVPAVGGVAGPYTTALATTDVLAATTLAPEVESMVARYEGDYEAVKARSLASTPGLRGKLSDLASQLARVQDENDAIRQRYLELEDAWTAMGDENSALKNRVAALEEELAGKTQSLNTSQILNKSLEERLEETHNTYLQQRSLAEDTKQTLIMEQLELGKKTKESDLLRRESASQETELRQLREAWNQREVRLQRLEEQRMFYEQQLSELGESYQAMVDKVGYVSGDPAVRSAALQVRVGGGYELLSNYLNRVFSEQDAVATQYTGRPDISPPQAAQKFPLDVTPPRP